MHFELREEQCRNVEIAGVEHLDDFFADLVGVFEADLAQAAQFDQFDNLFLVLTAKLVITLLADADDFDGLALTLEPVDVLAGKSHN